MRGDRIGFVGSAAEARKLTRGAPEARVIDAGGQFLTADPATPGPLRPGEAATFVVTDRDPSRGGAGDARPTFVVRGGRVDGER